MRVTAISGAAALALLLGGCAYDYLQRSDRIAYSAGDAVKANIARETTNPSHGAIYNTKGLGKNGAVIGGPEAPAAE